MKIARFFWPGFVIALLGLPVAIALLQRVPNVNDFEIVQDAPGWPSVFVAIGSTTDAEQIQTARKALWQIGPRGLLAHDEIRLLVVTYGAQLRLLRGEIRVPGTDCVYQTPPGAAIVNDDYLAFTRSPACRSMDDKGRQLDLTVTFRGKGHVGLATYFVPPAASDPNWLTLTAPNPNDPRPVPVVRGRYVDNVEGASYRRVELLAYVWHLSDSSLWIWALVFLALLAVFIGTAFVGTAQVCTAFAGPAASSSALGTSFGVGCVGLGLALLYVVLVPPLQAPDEPDHMLDFAQVAERPTLEGQLATLARRDHFERIHLRPAERFRPADIGHPFATAWGPDVFAQPVVGRSVTTLLWWTLLAPALRSSSVFGSLLGLRLANALMFSTSLGLAALLLSMVSRETVAPHMVSLGLLLIPTLPFFATHVSEFALLTSAYAFIAAIIAAFIFDGDQVHLLGLPLGVATSFVLAGGRSALPFAATLAAAIAGRALLGSPNQDVRGDTRRSLIFWIGLAIGLAMLSVLSTPEFQNGLWPGDTGHVPDRLRLAAELLRRHSWYVVLVMPAGFALDRGMSWIRGTLPIPGRFAIGIVKLLSYVVAAALVGSLLMSVAVEYPELSAIGVMPPTTAGEYVARVMKVAVTGFRLGHHDWLLSASFWEGFGWIDTLPGDGFVSLLVLLTALACVALLVHIASTARVRRAIWLGVLGAGWIVTLVLYAVSSYYVHRHLHGRYLVGLYLSMLAVCGSVLALVPRAPRSDIWWLRGLSREWSVVAAACAIHAYALRFVLVRYF